MTILIDTDIAIHWRDGHMGVRDRILALGARPVLSAISRIELENGVYRDPAQTTARRARLDVMLRWLEVMDFTQNEIAAYSRTLATAGFSKRKTNDRMIAATALVHGFTFATMNGRDFRDIEGLDLDEWEFPATA
jgi:tRNA(fMet)-specific endonuclease VapC